MLDLQVVLLDLVLLALIALAWAWLAEVVVLSQCLLDVVLGVDCLFALLTLDAFFLLDFDADLIGSQTFEALFLLGGLVGVGLFGVGVEV